MRVAIVHYWLVSMRGGEKVIEALCDMYPEADIFTLVYDADKVSDKIRSHRVIPSFLQHFPGSTRHYKSLLPLMPFALESLNLSGYDLIISSESGPAKGIIPPPDAVHICYCHTPMRYLWDHYHAYRDTAGLAARMIMPVVAPLLRSWDANSSLRVDRFVANSHHVADRIRKYYRRTADVVSPPVSVGDFSTATDLGDFYLCAGQLVPYKRVDLAVRAFTRMGRNLLIIGDGEKTHVDQLKKMAGPTIRFLGRTSFATLKENLARCRALVFPGEEDFGIVPVEAMASGRPVIAYGRGGALETVVPDHTGLLFSEQSVDALMEAVLHFEEREHMFRPDLIQRHAARFATNRFRSNMERIIAEEIAAKRGSIRSPEASMTFSDAFAGEQAIPLQ